MFSGEFDVIWAVVAGMLILAVVALVALAFTLGVRSLRRGKRGDDGPRTRPRE